MPPSWVGFNGRGSASAAFQLRLRRAAAIRVREKTGFAKSHSRNAPFPHEKRKDVYRFLLNVIRERDPNLPFTISTESMAMWKDLGPALGFTPADYVCGCGASATPGRLRLASNPWTDAQAAVNWDGTPAMERPELD